MEQSNSYYTPDITDLRIGFELDVLYRDQWRRVTTTADTDISEMAIHISSGDFRVPYLTKEQIAAEGWIGSGSEVGEFTKGIFEVTYWYGSRELIITDVRDEVRYSGSCRCINDFRLICKLLNL